ncbi:MAG: hypothetical protein ABS911_00950 [Carnobacterium sp.]|uniref:hypothetical protein n=1 Tax=Carnobacterium sp. TaxID=48221 RepID=UPI00331624BC
MKQLKVGHYSMWAHSILILTLFFAGSVITGCGTTDVNSADSASAQQKEFHAASKSSTAVATPLESTTIEANDGVITFDDFKGYWATFDSKESVPFQSDIGKYTVAITDDSFIPGEWGTTLGGSDILGYTIEGSMLTLELYTPDSNLEGKDETYLLTLELIEKDGLFVLKSANGSVIFYPVTSQEFLDAGWKIPSDSL